MSKKIIQEFKIGTIIQVKNCSYKIIDYYKKKEIEKNKIRYRYVYKCQCLKDGYEFERTQDQIKNGVGCPVCVNKVVIYGINSLADIRPDLIDYFVDKNLPKMVAPKSNKYTEIKCPHCGYIKRMSINNLTAHGFSCPICSDGISYPNKFVREFLNQLGIKYIPEIKFKWGENYLYDEYLPEYNMIIENDGEQHFKNISFGSKRNNAIIDCKKEQLAYNNSIRYFIRLDCTLSNKEYIKKSIMNSPLPKILNFSEFDINWNKCEENASSSLIHQVWNMWNDGISAHKIMDALKLSNTTIRDYIDRGFNSGICKEKCFFKKEKRNIKGNNNNHIFTIKPLYCFEEDAYYLSSSEYIKIHSNETLCYKSISRAAKNNITYKGKHFKYITKQEFNNIKLLSLNNSDIKVYGELIDNKYL